MVINFIIQILLLLVFVLILSYQDYYVYRKLKDYSRHVEIIEEKQDKLNSKIKELNNTIEMYRVLFKGKY